MFKAVRSSRRAFKDAINEALEKYNAIYQETPINPLFLYTPDHHDQTMNSEITAVPVSTIHSNGNMKFGSSSVAVMEMPVRPICFEGYEDEGEAKGISVGRWAIKSNEMDAVNNESTKTRNSNHVDLSGVKRAFAISTIKKYYPHIKDLLKTTKVNASIYGLFTATTSPATFSFLYEGRPVKDGTLLWSWPRELNGKVNWNSKLRVIEHPRLMITGIQGNIISGINGRSAADVLIESTGGDLSDLFLMIGKEKEKKEIVLAVTAVNIRKGLVAVDIWRGGTKSTLDAGMEIYLARLNKEPSLIDEMVAEGSFKLIKSGMEHYYTDNEGNVQPIVTGLASDNGFFGLDSHSDSSIYPHSSMTPVDSFLEIR